MKKILFLSLVLITFFSCKESGSDNDNDFGADSVTFKKEGELTITKADSSIIKLDIEIADNEFETQTGLMYRHKMEDDRGMLFIFESAQVHNFYMKNTEIPLDIIYITSDKKIATLIKNAVPFDESSLSSQVAVQYVLEVNAGMSNKWGLQKGDQVRWTKE